jgi:hypothetical protein
MFQGCGLDVFAWEYGPVPDCCEHGDSDCVYYGKFSEELYDS